MRRFVHRNTLAGAIVAAKTRDPSGYPVAHYHGDCTAPLQVALGARDSAVVPISGKLGKFNGRPWVDALVRCRNCDACAKHRRRLWTARAMDEIITHPRTWFVTLTFSPEWQAKVTMLAARKDRRFDALTEAEQFSLRADVVAPEVTKWLKRLRATAERRAAAQDKALPKVRYLWVAEAHKSGLPHIHALVHEAIGGGSLLYRDVCETWGHGFAHAKLIDDPIKGARYVAKYINKAATTRMRASQRYGNYGSGDPHFSHPTPGP